MVNRHNNQNHLSEQLVEKFSLYWTIDAIFRFAFWQQSEQKKAGRKAQRFCVAKLV